MKYKIIDNFLEEDDFLNIKKCFFPLNENERKIIWRYNKGIVRDPNLGSTNYEEYDWMYSYSFSNNKENSYFDLVQPIIKKLNCNKIFDARANLIVPTINHIHHEDHVDRKEYHNVALFYITTNNGYTVLKNVTEVKCVENRIVIFDGSIYHHSVTSTDKIRCVININFIPCSKTNKNKFSYK